MMNANPEIIILVSTYTNSMFSFAYNRVKEKEAAKDILQNTFLAAVESYPSFKNKSHPKTWLFAILRHKIVDFLRKKSSCPEFAYDTYNQKFFNSCGSWQKGQAPQNWDIEDNLFHNSAFIKVLSKCIDNLPQKWTLIIKLKYFEGMDTNKICEHLSITRANYWQITHRSKLHLRRSLEERWFKNN